MGLLLPLVALAATAAGTGLNVAANAQDTRAENNTVSDELQRQQQFQQKAGATYQNNLTKNAGVENAQQQIGQGQSQALNLYKTLQGAQTGGNASGISALSPQEQALTDARTGQQNTAGSNLEGYNQWSTNQGISNLLTGSSLGVTGKESQADAATLPYLLQGASHTGDSLSGIGGILSSLGMLAGLGGTAGMLGGLGSTAASAAPAASGWGGIGGGISDAALMSSQAGYGVPNIFQQPNYMSSTNPIQ